MAKIVDYSWSRPPPAVISAAGYLGAMRYLGNDGRCIRTAERDDLHAAGLGIGLIWETRADRVLGGAPAGRTDAGLANDFANQLGAPSSTPIYYCTDFHALPAQIRGPICDYYRAARDAGGREVRVYGGAPVIDHMRDVLGLVKGWQAAATSWSNNYISANAVMLQRVEYVLNNTSDANNVRCDQTEIDWLWGYDDAGGLPVTEDELRKIVADECTKVINNALSNMYTGSRAMIVPDDPAVYEFAWVNGERVRRHIKSQDEVNLLQFADQVAGAPGVVPPREITDPGQIEAFRKLPLINPEDAPDGPCDDDADTRYGEPIEPVSYKD